MPDPNLKRAWTSEGLALAVLVGGWTWGLLDNWSHQFVIVAFVSVGFCFAGCFYSSKALRVDRGKTNKLAIAVSGLLLLMSLFTGFIGFAAWP